MRYSYYATALIILCLTACLETPTNEKQINSPINSEAGCQWVTSNVSLFNSSEHRVTFKHEVCFEAEHEHIVLENNGTKITKLTFDVVSASFSVFQQGTYSEQEFVERLIEKYWEHDGFCKATKLDKNIWKIDDGKYSDADINFMPCGIYGRNFSGETVFNFNNGIVLHVPLSWKNKTIDFSSITYSLKL